LKQGLCVNESQLSPTSHPTTFFQSRCLYHAIAITRSMQACNEEGRSASSKKRCTPRHEISKRGGGPRSRSSRAAMMGMMRRHRPSRLNNTVRRSEEKILQMDPHLLRPPPTRRPAATTADMRTSPSCHRPYNRRTTAAAAREAQHPLEKSS